MTLIRDQFLLMNSLPVTHVYSSRRKTMTFNTLNNKRFSCGCSEKMNYQFLLFDSVIMSFLF